MTQLVKLHLAMPTSPISMLVPGPAALLPIQLPVTTSEKTEVDGPSTDVPGILGGNQDGVPGSSLLRALGE